MVSRHSMNVGFLKATPRLVISATKSIGLSLDKRLCFYLIRHATTSWLKHLSLVSLLLPKPCSKRRATCQRCVQVRVCLNAFKLMEECSHDFSKLPFPKHVIEGKPYELNDMQKWYKYKVVKSWQQGLTLAVYHTSRCKFQDSLRISSHSYSTSWQNMLICYVQLKIIGVRQAATIYIRATSFCV